MLSANLYPRHGFIRQSLPSPWFHLLAKAWTKLNKKHKAGFFRAFLKNAETEGGRFRVFLNIF